jgi:hypothetical protein
MYNRTVGAMLAGSTLAVLMTAGIGGCPQFFQNIPAAYVWSLDAGTTDAETLSALTTLVDGDVVVAGNFGSDHLIFPGCAALDQTSDQDAFVAKLDQDTGNCLWAFSFGDNGGGGDEGIFAVSGDADGDVFIAGGFANSLVLGDVELAGGDLDAFVAKLDGDDGAVLWAVALGGDATMALAYACKTDNNGDIVVAGQFSGTGVFGDSEFVADGPSDVFVARLSGTDGEVQLAIEIGAEGNNAATALDVDADNNVILATLLDYDFPVTLGTSELLKLDGTDFSEIFSVTHGDDDADVEWITAVAPTADGGVLMAGYFEGVIDFPTPLTAVGPRDGFLAQVDETGTVVWAKQFGGADGAFIRAMDVTTSGDILLTGDFEGTINFNPGSADDVLTSVADDPLYARRIDPTNVFLAQLDADGNHVWSAAFPSGPATGGELAVYGDEFVVFAGTYMNQINLGGTGLASGDEGASDLFFARYDIAHHGLLGAQ